MKKNVMTISAAFLMIAGTTVATASVNPVKPVAGMIEKIADADPYMRKHGEKVYLNYLNLEGNTVIVKVTDQENRVLYIERFKDSPVVEKAFNFESAKSGIYKVEVEVTSGDRTYSESLKVVR
ncbi:hypothetical protein [Robiginitalea sp. SC105]|uniref:hypothetical protein n=1 Tax=Robiginitalea sp. SC105 TaxID=2762332 RepID=UPI00163A2049|nr:hypothetical protein [Robiginitalea sp. SC105]MBC2839167.1 hypothetical protein [Robiginitalea sp. SC105]